MGDNDRSLKWVSEHDQHEAGSAQGAVTAMRGKLHKWAADPITKHGG